MVKAINCDIRNLNVNALKLIPAVCLVLPVHPACHHPSQPLLAQHRIPDGHYLVDELLKGLRVTLTGVERLVADLPENEWKLL